MVNGMEKFLEYFRDFTDQYVFIGGVACDCLMNDVGLDFRATKDFDVVLIIEALTEDFGNRFWQFVNDGGYIRREKSSGDAQFYRFERPEKTDYPAMIELFSRKIDVLIGKDDINLTPIHIGDECSSLSAILLNDSYYDLIRGGRELLAGIPVVKTEYLIPFKARAYIDLSERHSVGESIDAKKIRKHLNDVLRVQLRFTGNERVSLPEDIRHDMSVFIDMLDKNDAINMQSLKIKMDKQTCISRLKSIYQI